MFWASVSFCWIHESERVLRATLWVNGYFSILQMQELRSTEVKWFMWGCTVGNEGGNEGQVSPIQSCHAWSVHLREWWASGLSPGQLQAEELNELCVRWAVLRHFGGQTTKHPILGAYFVAQLGPLQSCNQGVRQDWKPIRVEGFTAKLM